MKTGMTQRDKQRGSRNTQWRHISPSVSNSCSHDPLPTWSKRINHVPNGRFDHTRLSSAITTSVVCYIWTKINVSAPLHICHILLLKVSFF